MLSSRSAAAVRRILRKQPRFGWGRAASWSNTRAALLHQLPFISLNSKPPSCRSSRYRLLHPAQRSHPASGFVLQTAGNCCSGTLNVASRLIVIDPAANVAVPASILLSTGINGLAHCVEGLYSKVQTPVTKALAPHAIGLFVQALPQVAKQTESIDARGALLAAAHLSGLVLMNARTTLHHAICHALGALTGAPHGLGNAVILTHAIDFNAPVAPAAMSELVRAW